MNWKESRSTWTRPKTKKHWSPWTSPSSKSSLWTRIVMSKRHYPPSLFLASSGFCSSYLRSPTSLKGCSASCFSQLSRSVSPQSYAKLKSFREPARWVTWHCTLFYDATINSRSLPHFILAPDFPEQSERFKGPRPRAGFWQLHERRESFSRTGRRLHFGHPAKAEGREEQRESVTRPNTSSGVWRPEFKSNPLILKWILLLSQGRTAWKHWLVLQSPMIHLCLLLSFTIITGSMCPWHFHIRTQWLVFLWGTK